MKERVITFIDILGFKKLTDDIKKGDEKYEKYLLSILREIKSAEINHNNMRKEGRVLSDALMKQEITAFSDCIVISSETSFSGVAWLFTLIRLLNYRLLEAGILCRGGIAKGLIHHEESIVFGPGMIDAYMLESKVAVHPRIVIDEKVIRLIVNERNDFIHGERGQDVIRNRTAEFVDDSIKKDDDQLYFINPFVRKERCTVNENQEVINKEFLNDHEHVREVIVNKLNSNEPPKIRAKYLWLAQKYNELAYSGTNQKKIIV